jgi:hypothetical protein
MVMRQHTFIRFACKTNERMLPQNAETSRFKYILFTCCDRFLKMKSNAIRQTGTFKPIRCFEILD